MLPPDSTATTGRLEARCRVVEQARPRRPRRPARRPAWPARGRNSRARDSASSLTVTTSSTSSLHDARTAPRPGSPTAMPSAIVVIERQRHRARPAASEAGYAAAPSACTPTTRTSGRERLHRGRDAGRAARRRRRRPRRCARRGTARGSPGRTVPCPATMSGWSNGWISTAPVSRGELARPRPAHSSTLCPCELDLARRTPGWPPPWAAARPRGMKTVDVDAEQLRGERDALGVVAGAGRDDAARPLLVGEPGHPGVGAADLERPGALEVLALEQHRTADPVRQRPAVLQRGAAGPRPRAAPGRRGRPRRTRASTVKP